MLFKGCVADVADVADPLQTNTTTLPETDWLLLTSALEDATGEVFRSIPAAEVKNVHVGDNRERAWKRTKICCKQCSK